MLPIYVDIDGTLTNDGEHSNGTPNLHRINKLKKLIIDGVKVVIWSARGDEYANTFIKKHSLQPYAALGKPEYCIDDKSSIRPHLKILDPTTLD